MEYGVECWCSGVAFRCGGNLDLFTVVDSVPDQGILLCFFCPFRCGKVVLSYPYSCLINT